MSAHTKLASASPGCGTTARSKPFPSSCLVNVPTSQSSSPGVEKIASSATCGLKSNVRLAPGGKLVERWQTAHLLTSSSSASLERMTCLSPLPGAFFFFFLAIALNTSEGLLSLEAFVHSDLTSAESPKAHAAWRAGAQTLIRP